TNGKVFQTITPEKSLITPTPALNTVTTTCAQKSNLENINSINGLVLYDRLNGSTFIQGFDSKFLFEQSKRYGITISPDHTQIAYTINLDSTVHGEAQIVVYSLIEDTMRTFTEKS